MEDIIENDYCGAAAIENDYCGAAAIENDYCGGYCGDFYCGASAIEDGAPQLKRFYTVPNVMCILL